jgi:hypothetical protein
MKIAGTADPRLPAQYHFLGKDRYGSGTTAGSRQDADIFVER